MATSLRVSDLIKILETIDRNAVVVVNGKVAQGVRTMSGRLRSDGYFGDNFTRHDTKGRDTAVVFTRLTEFSDGKVDEAEIA